MHLIMRLLFCLGMLFLVSGCSTYSLQELRSATPKGTPFQAQLAVRYLKFSEEKAAKYNWIDSGYFADKGLQAAYGHDVPPENLDVWDEPKDKQAGLLEARKKLVGMLQGKAKETQPNVAADAQYFYDCWVENQNNDWQPDEIAYCRDGFEQAMLKLGGAPPPEAASPGAAPAAKVETPKKEAYIVFFGTNRDTLDENGQRLIDSVAADIKKQGGEDYSVVVNGHTDTVGNKRYNSDLSKRRAQNVLQALVERGIPKMLVRAFGFGDTDLKVQTGPGVAEPKNRRVEIYIGDQ